MLKTILKILPDLPDGDLYALCEVVDEELLRREDLDAAADDDDESARRRIVERGQSYRRRLGSAAPPVRIIGLIPSKRRAA
jgi:hypothetical protein